MVSRKTRTSKKSRTKKKQKVKQLVLEKKMSDEKIAKKEGEYFSNKDEITKNSIEFSNLNRYYVFQKKIQHTTDINKIMNTALGYLRILF